MRTKILNNSAFTLLEILLASIIFIVTIAGVFVTLDAMRRPVQDKESSLAAANFGRQVLEALRTKVDARSTSNFYDINICSVSCNDFSLALGTHVITSLPPTGIQWPQGWNPAVNTLSYVVTCADGSVPTHCGADVARRVDLNINWPDAP